MKVKTTKSLPITGCLMIICLLLCSCYSFKENQNIIESNTSSVFQTSTENKSTLDDGEPKNSNSSQQVYPEQMFDGDFEVETKSFNNDKEIFKYFVTEIQTLLEKNSLKNEQRVTVVERNGNYYFKFKDILLEKEMLLDTKQKSFDNYLKIKDIFLEMGDYSFVGFRYENNYLQFESENGQYFLIYVFDGVSPRKKNYQNYNDRFFDIEHIEGNWYQMKQ